MGEVGKHSEIRDAPKYPPASELSYIEFFGEERDHAKESFAGKRVMEGSTVNRKKLLREINGDSDQSGPTVEKTEKGPQVTEKDFKEAIAGLWKLDLTKIIVLFKKLFLDNANRIDGLGLKLIDKFESDSEKAQVAARLRNINESKSWEDKIGTSHASFLHEFSLHRAGYRPRTAETAEVIIMSPGQKIEDVVGDTAWQQIKNGDVLNALDYEKPLVGHSDTRYYLHVDAKGFPIYLAGSDENSETRTTLLFEKEKNDNKRAEMENESKLEVLKSKLEPGDIIWTYKKDSIIIPQLIRAGQDPNFPFAHMLVYLGDGLVGQIHKKGGESFTLEEMVGSDRNYKALCIGELVGENKTDFVRGVDEWIHATKDYAESVYSDHVNHVLTGKPLRERQLKKGDSAVCTDLLRAAKNPELRALLDSGEARPYEFFKLGIFRAKYSVAQID